MAASGQRETPLDLGFAFLCLTLHSGDSSPVYSPPTPAHLKIQWKRTSLLASCSESPRSDV